MGEDTSIIVCTLGIHCNVRLTVNDLMETLIEIDVAFVSFTGVASSPDRIIALLADVS